MINKDLIKATNIVFNPRNAMYISKNDGFFDNNYNQQRDTIINMNTFVYIGRDAYSNEQIETIRRAQSQE